MTHHNTILSIISASILSMSLLLASCGSARKAVEPQLPPTADTVAAHDTPSAAAIDAIASSFGSWNTLSAGGNVKLGGTMNLSSSMQLRMTRDKAISISLRPMLGIEVAKIVVTGDSIIMIDRYHKQYLAEKISLITAGVPINVGTLQDIFLGRAFVFGKGTLSKQLTQAVKLTNVDGTLQVTPKSQYQGFSYAFDFAAATHLIKALAITPAAQQNAVYKVDYSAVEKTQVGNVARESHISTKLGKTPFSLTVSLGSMQWDKDVKITSKIPDGYKRIDGKQLLNMKF